MRGREILWVSIPGWVAILALVLLHQWALANVVLVVELLIPEGKRDDREEDLPEEDLEIDYEV